MLNTQVAAWLRRLGANLAPFAVKAEGEGLSGALLAELRGEALDELGMQGKIMRGRVLAALDAELAASVERPQGAPASE